MIFLATNVFYKSDKKSLPYKKDRLSKIILFIYLHQEFFYFQILDFHGNNEEEFLEKLHHL